ncbi:uncharacterized protein GGS22DRAFT_173259 [Annulohypoxylon maeteangense]|uniref:uncharacterized protein n=1 Tax=Annulohypoxylon maeteangense TaxID=1927788 RepID=UPI0020087C52|nr:uncharacterized protein GGS22DRAFT_173259 [Annulohypoxylon maeteangense]KAI0881066.1 hypothetical protein GGS22DRAFT_173259 [Annulohypoxylon maeteangense]
MYLLRLWGRSNYQRICAKKSSTDKIIVPGTFFPFNRSFQFAIGFIQSNNFVTKSPQFAPPPFHPFEENLQFHYNESASNWPQMAKERADKPRKKKKKAERAGKSEKISRDKVKKHKKKRKPRQDDDIEMIDGWDEPSKLDDSLSAETTFHPAAKSKRPKKFVRGEREKGPERSPTEQEKNAILANTISLPLRLAMRKPDDDGGAPLPFAIDTNPTPVNVDSLTTVGITNDEENLERNAHQAGPKAPNRKVRRQARLLEEKRERIRRELGIPEGSSEKQDLVEAKIAAWVTHLEVRASVRLRKKGQRNEKGKKKHKRARTSKYKGGTMKVKVGGVSAASQE